MIDYDAAAALVNAQARAWHELIARWQPRPCPRTWQAPSVGSPVPRRASTVTGEPAIYTTVRRVTVVPLEGLR